MLSLGGGLADAQEPSEPTTETVEVEADDESLWSLIVGGISALIDWLRDATLAIWCFMVTEVLFPFLNVVLGVFAGLWTSAISPLLAAANVPPDVLYVANVFFPVQETFAAIIGFATYAIGLAVIRWILKVIPTIG